MTFRHTSGMVFTAILAEALWRVGMGASTQAPAEPGATADQYQRSAQLWKFNAIAANGPGRGEEIYFYKCWFCHNKFQKTGPVLHDLYQRSKLLSGQPVNDRSVAEKIRTGGAAMPSYRAVLPEADVADLLSYFRSGTCCFDAEEPPIRTTVYTNEEGRYEFPVLESGAYTWRIARPLEFKPWVKEAVQISGSMELPEIVLERASRTEFLPPTPDVLSQLTGSEWLLNLPGTGEEKRGFSLMCGFGCHSYYEVFRNRYDEASWRLIVQRMQRGGGSPLINVSTPPDPKNPPAGRTGRNLIQDEEVLVKWLARVRGLDASTHFNDALVAGTTAGTITSVPANTAVTVEDAAFPHGVKVTVTATGPVPGSARVRIQLDGKTGTIKLAVPGTYFITDPMLDTTVAVTQGGPAEIELTLNGASTVVTIDEGGSATVTETTTGGELAEIAIGQVTGVVSSAGRAGSPRGGARVHDRGAVHRQHGQQLVEERDRGRAARSGEMTGPATP